MAGEDNIGDYILHHIVNTTTWNIPFLSIHLPQFHLFGMDFSISNHVLMIWIASALLLLLTVFPRRERHGVPGKLACLLEMIVQFVRDEIVISSLGEEDGKRLTPYFLTVFMFILTCNLMGIIPLFTTPTGDISVTAALALMTLTLIFGMGIYEQGVVGFFKSLLPKRVPFFLIFLLFPIEFFGIFIKAFALCLRLFANMIAGHIVIMSLLGLIIIFQSVLVAIGAVPFAMFIFLLEVLVALIQAFVFTLLSCIFIGMAMHPEH